METPSCPSDDPVVTVVHHARGRGRVDFGVTMQEIIELLLDEVADTGPDRRPSGHICVEPSLVFVCVLAINQPRASVWPNAHPVRLRKPGRCL